MEARGGDEAFVAVDWGTSRLRLRLVGAADGALIHEASYPSGVGKMARGEHQAVFCFALLQALQSTPAQAWLDSLPAVAPPTTLRVLLAGMVSAMDVGWEPMPYLRAPAALADFAAASRAVEIGAPDCVRWWRRLRLHFFPGLRDSADIARGEELEALGILSQLVDAPPEGLIVLPGTHSKWMRYSGGRLLGFATVMTGDLHDALHRATLLQRCLPKEPAAVGGPLLRRFDEGLRLAAELGGLTALFRARARAILPEDRLAADAASALLSGILIGGELRERLAAAQGQPVLVAGTRALQQLYLRAFEVLGAPARAVPAELSERASVAALKELRAALCAAEREKEKGE